MSFCLIACLLRCISLALGAKVIWGTSLPSSPSRERTPFRFLECDVQGGDANQIQGADAGTCLEWHTNCFQIIESPSASIYCLRTGFGRCRCSPSMDVFAASFCIGKEPKGDCFAFLAYKYGSAGSVSFDIINVHVANGNQSGRSLFCSKQSGGHQTNGMPKFVRQPNGPQSWPTVREGTTAPEVLDVYIRSVFFSLSMPCIAHVALPSGSILRRGIWTNVGWKQCCRIDWFGVERVYVHDLVSSYIIFIVPFVFLSSNTWIFVLSCMIVQVARRKESIYSCALPS